MRIAIALLLLALSAPACRTTSTAGPEAGGDSVHTTVQSTMPFKGTITFLELEGGFYGIIAEDGEHYLPINLGIPFREDGLRVQFDMRIRTDVMSTAMWGTPVEIIEMGRLE